MNILYVPGCHPEETFEHLIYRKHPVDGWQFWAGSGWCNSYVLLPFGPPLLKDVVVSWEDTWAEPEEEG